MSLLYTLNYEIINIQLAILELVVYAAKAQPRLLSAACIYAVRERESREEAAVDAAVAPATERRLHFQLRCLIRPASQKTLGN